MIRFWRLAPWQPVFVALATKALGSVGQASSQVNFAALPLLLHDIIRILVLTVVTSLLGALVVAALFGVIYYVLVDFGVSYWGALALTIGSAAVLLAIMAALTLRKMRNLKIPVIEVSPAANHSSKIPVQDVMQSFWGGVTKRSVSLKGNRP